jgi:hypothetical protein
MHSSKPVGLTQEAMYRVHSTVLIYVYLIRYKPIRQKQQNCYTHIHHFLRKMILKSGLKLKLKN